MEEKNYKDFDDMVKSMLADAEEDVPAHLADDMFTRLDAVKRKRALLLRFRYAVAAVAAAAAAFLCFIIRTEGPSGPAVTSPSLKSSSEMTAMAAEDNISHDPDLQEIPVTGRHVAERPARRPDPAEEDPTTEGDGISEEPDGIEESIHIEESESKPMEDVTDTDSVVPFDFPDDGNTRRKASVVSFTIGGDVASNGDPAGISRNTSLRTPEQLVNAEWVEQTGKESSYSIPLSFGAGVKIALGKHFGINTGVRYSMLQRSFSGIYTKVKDGKISANISSDIRHTIHYLGIPVQGYVNILDGQRVRLYGYAGGEVERAVANIYRIKTRPEDILFRDNVKGVQLSANAGFGIEFSIINHLGIYVNPGVVYYFDCNQPVSIRTQQPLMMNFEVGLRVGL